MFVAMLMMSLGVLLDLEARAQEDDSYEGFSLPVIEVFDTHRSVDSELLTPCDFVFPIHVYQVDKVTLRKMIKSQDGFVWVEDVMLKKRGWGDKRRMTAKNGSLFTDVGTVRGVGRRGVIHVCDD